jgi:hypothetical protein
MKKSMVDYALLTVMALAVIMIALLIQQLVEKVPGASKIAKIKQEVEISIDVNDESSALLPLLRTDTLDTNVMDAIALKISGGDLDENQERAINTLADEMDVSIEIYDKESNLKGQFGSRKLGEHVVIDVPLPSGRTGIIRLITDVEFPGGDDA